jgi:hypothetical protein
VEVRRRDYAQFYSRSHDAVIQVYDDARNVIETHEHKGDPGKTVRVHIKSYHSTFVLGHDIAPLLRLIVLCFSLSTQGVAGF